MDDLCMHTLPDDVAALKALCATLLARSAAVGTLELKLAERELHIAVMTAEVLRLKKLLYGPRADRLSSANDIAQMLLEFAAQLEARPVDPADIPDGEPAPADPADTRRVGAAQGKASRSGRGGRRRIADLAHLPVTRHEHDLTEEQKACPCCGECRAHMGIDESWQIEYIPGHFERLHHIRHTYACAACDAEGDGAQVATAAKSRETAPVEKGMAGPGLLAYAVTSKFADYLPLYRLENIFTRNGLSMSRSTLSVWCRDVAEIAMPLYRLMCGRVRASGVVATDDTIMPMQARKKAQKARIWIYAADAQNPYNVFDFTPSRSRDGPTKFLEEYQGTLLADGYGGYDGIVAGNGMTRAGCWAHARRKLVDAERSEPRVAAEAVALISMLFEIERRLKDATPAERALGRERESRPVIDALKDRLPRWKSELLPKHAMTSAVGYALNQWEPLTVFLSDPDVPIHNNLAEQEMKRQALNRKNSLFVGNERGGETAAILSSLTSSCRRHDVDPQVYFTQLLVNLPGVSEENLGDWLPDVWKARHAGRG